MNECMERGVALLDKHFPDWVSKVNIVDFDINDYLTCILAQVFGDYLDGKTILGIRGEDGSTYGFCSLRADGEEGAALTEEWRVLIRERRAACSV